MFLLCILWSILVLVICKSEKNYIKYKVARRLTEFSHYKSMEICPWAGYSALCDPIWPQFKPLNMLFFLVISTNENIYDQERRRYSHDSVDNTDFHFLNAQGQLTLRSLVGSGQISNSSETMAFVTGIN